jgi:beta-glucosidase
LFASTPLLSGADLWKDPSQPLDARIKDLIGRMSLDEKVGQLRNGSKEIPRLGIPSYDYWSEALHGVARAGHATVFPQAIAMAATWDAPLLQSEGDVIATEGRALYNVYRGQHQGNTPIYRGLTFWSPNVNIFRDPRWGRGQETYGEDPFLSGSLAVGFIHGIQGDDPRYLKAMACAKHFAVHSGPEPLRHRFDVWPSESDLYDTYLPQFEMTVREGHVGGVMGAYNALYGIPACCSPLLLEDILRYRWQFKGYIVSDCAAITNIYADHHFVSTPELAASVAVKAGCDICCGKDYDSLVGAVRQGLIGEGEINHALYYALQSRFELGLFDPSELVPFNRIGLDQNDTPAHAALALKVAEESIVLLKNDGLLPLNRASIHRIAVIGENANSVLMLVGNYNGTPSHPVTLLDGIRAAAGPAVTVTYDRGCPLAIMRDGSNRPTPEQTEQAIADAEKADVVVYVGGISAQFEGEEMASADAYEGFDGGDREQIELPAVQESLLEHLHATGKPIVFVNCSGSAMAMPWAAAHLPAILQAWYPGEQGGTAVARILFGDANPSGKLPITFYAATADLPPFQDYSLRNRTYRYFNGTPLFAFGSGLSYTRFSIAAPRADAVVNADGSISLRVTVTNTGRRAGAEVVQAYFRHQRAPVTQPHAALCAFQRVDLQPGESRTITLQVARKRLRYWDPARNDYWIRAGVYEFLIGDASNNPLATILAQVDDPPASGRGA